MDDATEMTVNVERLAGQFAARLAQSMIEAEAMQTRLDDAHAEIGRLRTHVAALEAANRELDRDLTDAQSAATAEDDQ